MQFGTLFPNKLLLIMMFPLDNCHLNNLHCTQNDDEAEEVWTAALGSFLQLTVENGEPDLVNLQSVPTSILSAFLDKCVKYNWYAFVSFKTIQQKWFHFVSMMCCVHSF